MPKPIRFVLALHNHQPIGNFEDVFEQAYQDSYLPFLDVFEQYDALKIALHTSGSLMEWLDQAHPEYVDRLAELVNAQRMEIIGGAYYEPILGMLPARDRVGQIERYSNWLESRLGADIRGMWIPERVWEQSYVRDLTAAKIEYTILDDFHFKNAGLEPDDLTAHFVTEDDGHLMSIFPGSEPMRYMVPFGRVDEVITHLGELSEKHDNAVVVFGDDGEKFGTWPETHRHVYQDGWLRRFFDALTENRDWIWTVTPSEAIDQVEPAGKIYLPDCSYREMTEWAMPAERQVEYDHLNHEMESDERWPQLKRFVSGGFWRNFKVRYPETDEMYCRMMQVSRLLRDVERQVIEQSHAADPVHERLDLARAELYRGQCNCSYWHGAFGGVYLPHLRNAVYEHLIAAENLLKEIEREDNEPWVEIHHQDYNFDGHQEIELANDRLSSKFAPTRGGMLYELDIRSICHNLGATLSRRPEAYHAKVLNGSSEQNGDCASIHDRIVFKQEGLDKLVQYDSYPRKTLIDLFYDENVSLDDVVAGNARQLGDFVNGSYHSKIKRNPDRVQLFMSRDGMVDGCPIKVKKVVSLNADSNMLEIAYQLEQLPHDRRFRFASELNFAGMPGGAEDRFFHDTDGNRLGKLNKQLDLRQMPMLALSDEWLGIDVAMHCSQATDFFAFPIQTVSQSEGGFELVHQSVAVQPHWMVEPNHEGTWSVSINLLLDTSLAESRRNHHEDKELAVV